MSKPPPANLMDWSKNDLVKELQRLRAILREHGHQVADSPRSGGGMVDVAGDPNAFGGVVLDTREAVLMDELEVCLVDTKQGDKPAMMMVLQGRVNYQTRRVKQAYLFGPDGAAGLTVELLALSVRAGGEFGREFKESFDERTS